SVVGFIGLGNMGGPMAANLSKAGHEVRGFDVSPAAIEAAGKAGINCSASAVAVADGTDAVITMLPSGQHVRDVYLGPAGLIVSARPGTLFIDSSTIDVDTARQVGAAAAEAGMEFLDAPVSGGVGGAAAGTLTFMVGGTVESFTRAKPLLEKMGGKIVHCGDTGAGQAAKICNNMILGISMIGVCEAFVLAEKLGLSHQALFDVASSSSGQCWSLTSYCPVPGPVPASPANGGYKPGFASALMWKDLKLAQEAATAAGASTPLGAAAAQLYALHNAWGEGGADFSGIIHLIRGRGGEAAG
ncbi:MAG: 3-hydroxyisobutyrate dehydrogenase, partial [Microvirga sp.]